MEEQEQRLTIFELSFKQVMGGNVPAGLLELRVNRSGGVVA